MGTERSWRKGLGSLDLIVLEPEFTQLKILDTQIAMLGATAVLLERKARRLKWAMLVLAAAILLVAVGLGLH